MKTLNPLNAKPVKTSQTMQQRDRKPVKYSPKLSLDVVSKLDSYSQIELKVLKDKYMLEYERIESLLKQIEARELELDQAENVELRKQGNCKITGQKRGMSISPERESKRKRLVKSTELNSKETRKVEAVTMRKCGEILAKLMNSRHGWVFNEPVDVVAFGLKDYYEIVKRPMDLGTVKSKLNKRVYKDSLDFAKDVELTFNNALAYNEKGDEVHTMATDLLDMFRKLMAYKKFEAERVIVDHQKFSKPSAEFTQSRVVSSKPVKLCEEADKKSVSKQKGMVSEATENPRMRREMRTSERDKLGMALLDLAEEYVDEILEIVAKRNSNMSTPAEDGEIELDIETLDNETLWDLNEFARLKLKAEQKNKAT
ncbi:hypothetical protein POM88_047663 [Heracleum sosnowskyi]|uniref:Uncharacterized protein n=1 Tax=Heracleum sosnowskyi TaxID=360622 RepID=A0AAD8LZV2_9APIA|nr:hypothetical protein POM88_047663 [Heracleum sosnowskyi]